MSDTPEQPVLLDLASLPREQIGPYLILGVDKDASPEEIERHWAQRLIWSRAKQFRTPLEDVNWAKEVLADRDRRVAADVQSLNPDTLSGELRQLLDKYGPLEPEIPAWVAVEAPLPDLPELPAEALPELESLRANLPAPEIPTEFPAIDRMLADASAAPLDPWDV